MAAPVVQNLDQILAELDPAYAGTRQLYQQQQGSLGQKYAGQLQGMETRKTNEFRDINRGANARGMAFSGMPVEEQTRYLGEQYLPGIANLQQQQNTEGMQLQMSLAELDRERRLKATDMRSGQQQSLLQWQQAEADRAFRERMQREQIAAENARAAAARAAQRDSSMDPLNEFDAYIANQFKNSGGAGNRNITRQQQDRWVENWLNQRGVANNNRQAYWNQINTNYNRNANAQKDWRYKR